MFTVHSKYIRGFLLYIRNWTIKDSALKKFSDTSKRFIEDQGSLTLCFPGKKVQLYATEL